MMTNGLKPNDTVALYGMSFKADTDDVRNSFSIDVLHALNAIGCKINVHDPHISSMIPHLPDIPSATYKDDIFEAASSSSKQIFMTPWAVYKELDLKQLGEKCAVKNIFDTNHIFSASEARSEGFEYDSIRGGNFESSYFVSTLDKA